MSDISELIERVRAATGWDQELDADIAEAVGIRVNRENFTRYTQEWSPFIYDLLGCNKHPLPNFTGSISDAVALVGRVLPGWWVTCGMCDLSGHASIGPDYNGPHRERLLREWPQEQFHSGFDEDLEPGGNWSATCRAIIVCLLMAKQAETQP